MLTIPPDLEPRALDLFWAASEDRHTRLELLQVFGKVEIARDTSWDYVAVRSEIGWRGLSADRCFACFNADRQRQWHHVIWLKHGGSNGRRNYVDLCAACHETVHGFRLYGTGTRDREWARLAEVIGRIPLPSRWRHTA